MLLLKAMQLDFTLRKKWISKQREKSQSGSNNNTTNYRYFLLIAKFLKITLCSELSVSVLSEVVYLIML